MDDINKEDDSLAVELYRNTMTGQWKKVVKMYEEHKIKAMSAKINTSGDTALHVAVSIAPDKEAQQLVRVIKDCYDEEVKKINDRYATEFKKIEDWYDEEVEKIKDKAEYEDSLKYLQKKRNDDNNVYDKKVEEEISDILESTVWIKNNEGNTPLHVAATAQRISICILLIRSFNSFQSVLGMHNIRGESPLFLAAFHGHKKIFLYFHLNILLGNSKFSNTDPESIDPAYLRTDGETILHCAIRWEYFDLAFEILDLEPMLAYFVNEQGITPLHLLASKPAVFRSGFHLGRWKKIIYHCIYVEELKRQEKEELEHPITLQKLNGSVIEEINDSSKTEDKNNQNLPKRYQTCIWFHGKLKAKAQAGQNADEENPNESNVTGQSELKGSQDSSKDPNVHSKGQNADEENPSKSNVTGQSEIEGSQDSSKAQPLQVFIRRYAINIFYLFYKILSWVILRLGYEDLKKKKEKHVHSVEIMKLLIDHAKEANFDFSREVGPKQIMNQQETRKGPPPSSLHLTTDSDTTTDSQTGQHNGNKRNGIDLEEKKSGRGKEETSKLVNTDTETPVLLAARNGITEMVEQILAVFPLAINYRSKGKNIVLWAVKNRQPRVLQLLLKRDFVKRKLIHEVDTEKNNALHLAAEIGEKKPWRIPGAALQMQWEIKWYQFVKDNMPQHFCYQLNEKDKTPEEIFNKTHEDLVKQGGEWLKKTSESCSVVAALIATVAFAASTTIPGNINEKSGKPNLENQPELTVFAISSLIALCFSITALFSFLAILTSRYEHKDFRRDLPKKLLLGLTSLFVSITSMLGSFCAGHFFMLKDKLKDKAFPVYAATCLPVVFFAIQQLPLYLDIVWAIFKKVPQSSFKAISL
ncbi:uncharacterized protein LOC142612514 [Castanea sativa]|uniref:uncharacterized protein LOC142612514 n=1 Tax=Castanea sativa TaxID=21020 RepID=UPI003F64A61D